MAIERNPSDRAADSAAREKIISDATALRKREETKLKTAVDTVIQTEAGQVLWKWLFHKCGFNVTSLTRKTDGEIAELSTHCKEAQRLVYLQLRALASPELLHKVEAFAETIETGGTENGAA